MPNNYFLLSRTSSQFVPNITPKTNRSNKTNLINIYISLLLLSIFLLCVYSFDYLYLLLDEINHNMKGHNQRNDLEIHTKANCHIPLMSVHKGKSSFYSTWTRIDIDCKFLMNIIATHHTIVLPDCFET